MRQMTDRPSTPLTEAEYREIVNTADPEAYDSTIEYMIDNREIITDLVFQMSTKAACEAYWNSDIKAWTESGKIAIDAIIDTIDTCLRITLRHLNGGRMGPIGMFTIVRALARKQYNAWRPPSETYLCM